MENYGSRCRFRESCPLDNNCVTMSMKLRSQATQTTNGNDTYMYPETPLKNDSEII